ncbi:MAG: tetratricopeptide repeat protein, partial [Candidatus Aminicenantes bacterium]|nr:tetratricopeptide repeat protein [Candidatus Aminicenantes bacterium]
MRKKSMIFVAIISLLIMAGLRLAAEVSVEEVVQAGRFVFYRDHADPHKYYYVPDQPRLATKRDGTPEFTFIKYTKTDGATKGGVLHFLVTWGFTSGELSSAESALKGIDSQAKLAGPVPFKEGTFQVISATAGKDGLFNRRIVGEGKAPVLPGQKAAVSIALTEEGASLLWESFKNPTSDVSVQYVLKFSGITPAFQAKLKVDWDKVYTQHDIKAAVEGTVKVVKLRADLGATLEELRQKGAIQLEIVGENENMQKLLETAYNHILELMCDKVPVGGGVANSSTIHSFFRPRTMINRYNDWSEDYFGSLEVPKPDLVMDVSAKETSGGPNDWNQQEQQTTSAENFGCSAADKRRAEQLYQKGLALGVEKKYLEAIDQFKKAYAACSDPIYYFRVAYFYERFLYDFDKAEIYLKMFLQLAEEKNAYSDMRQGVANKISDIDKAREMFEQALTLRESGKYLEAGEEFLLVYGLVKNPSALVAAGYSFEEAGDAMENNRRDNYEKALELLEGFLRDYNEAVPEAKLDGYKRTVAESVSNLRVKIAGLPAAQPQGNPEQQAVATTGGQAATTGAQQTATGAERATSGTQAGDVRGALGQQVSTTGQTTEQTTGQQAGAQQTTSGQTTSGTQTTPPPTTTSGAQAATQTGRPQAAQPTT